MKSFKKTFKRWLNTSLHSNTAPSSHHHQSMTQLMGMDYARFSDLLPYRYFDDKYGLYINNHSLGFALELAPLAGANEEIIHGIADLLKNHLTDQVTMQVMLCGNACIGERLDALYAHRLAHVDPLFCSMAKQQYDYYQKAAKHGFTNRYSNKMTLRDYRVFVFVSQNIGFSDRHAAQLCDLRDDLQSEFTSIGIANQSVFPDAFLTILRHNLQLNPDTTHHVKAVVDRYRELHQQVVPRDFELTVEPTHVNLHTDAMAPGQDIQMVSLSLKSLPELLMLWQQAEPIANIAKPERGIPCPFILNVHIKCKPKERSKLVAMRKAHDNERKANSPLAKWIPGTTQAAIDWKKIRDDLNTDAIQLCEVYYSCTLLTHESKRREHISEAIAAFRGYGLEIYAIRYQQLQSLVALMPFTVEQGMWQDLKLLDRINTMTTWNATNLLPLVADYKGHLDDKGILAPTFRHQIASIDLFHQGLDNYNAAISATSGSGKSVLSQSLVESTLADDGRVWVIDIGNSYKNLCDVLGGTYLTATHLKLNPFSNVTDIGNQAEAIRDLLAVMASPNQGLSDVQQAWLLDAVLAAWKVDGQSANIDSVLMALQAEQPTQHSDHRFNDLMTLLNKYSATHSTGLSSHLFNGHSLLNSEDPRKRRFMVLELGELESQPDLMKAVLFAVILHIENHMYQGSRRQKKLCIIDEAWRLLAGSNQVAARFIGKGFRTARKHNGAFVTISQHIKDFYVSPEAEAAWANSETKLLLRQNDKAFRQFISDYPDYFSEFEVERLQQFKPSAQNGFSEIMVQQGSHSRFHRLFLDPHTRIRSSSNPKDVEAIRERMQQGETLTQAVDALARARFGDELHVGTSS